MEETAKKSWKEKLSFAKARFKEGWGKFKALVLVQLKDKIDFSWTKQRKTRIQKTVFAILKFLIIAIAVFGILNIVKLLFMIKEEILSYYLVFLGIFVVLNLFTVIFGLVKSLYYAEDNKVLVTYPVSSGKLFLSKIIVYQIFEFKKALDMLVPVTIGFVVTGFFFGVVPIYTILWCLLPLALLSIVTVLLGALLSIPALYIYKTFQKVPVLELILLAALVGAAVYGLIYVITLIPINKGDIDIIKQWPIIRSSINSFILKFSNYIYPITYAFRAMVGETGPTYSGYRLLPYTFGRFGIMLAIAVVLFVIVFLIIKPFFFNMMTKTFEFEKKTISAPKHNKPKQRYVAFVGKELKLVFRDFEISASYICVYLLTPILLLFIDRIFMAMDRSAQGDLIAYAINILLIVLPLLASSTIISTIYSREGRAAYLKKTKPVKPYFPLISKLLFNLVLCIPSIAGCGVVFSQFAQVSPFSIFALCFAVLGFQYGHIFLSAALDLMNPQNELYATEGDSISNPNERKSTIFALIFSIVIALISYIFLKESFNATKTYDGAFIKLMIIGIVFMVVMFILLILKIKAFYIDRQEASREWKNPRSC